MRRVKYHWKAQFICQFIYALSTMIVSLGCVQDEYIDK